MKKYVILIVFVFMLVTTLGLGNWLETSSETNCLGGPNGPVPKIPQNTTLFRAQDLMSEGNIREDASMRLGTGLESDWQNWRIALGAYGPYQIQDPGVINVGITWLGALNPVISTEYMAPRYKAALNYVDPNLWNTDPERAAEEVAVGAEKPLKPYYDGRAKDVHIRWQQVLTMMHLTNADFRSVSPLRPAPTGPSSSANPSGKFSVNPITPPTTATCQTLSNDYNSYIKAAPAGAARTVVTAALKEVGVPYVFAGGTFAGPSVVGGRGPGFDCSGLAMYSFHKIGIDLPHKAAIQWQLTRKFQVSLAKAKPGDLIFFVTDGSYAAPGHVGIYLGNHMMVDAPHTGENVQVEPISSAYSPIVGITHPFK